MWSWQVPKRMSVQHLVGWDSDKPECLWYFKSTRVPRKLTTKVRIRVWNLRLITCSPGLKRHMGVIGPTWTPTFWQIIAYPHIILLLTGIEECHGNSFCNGRLVSLKSSSVLIDRWLVLASSKQQTWQGWHVPWASSSDVLLTGRWSHQNSWSS